jgi:hypothetical protein
MTRTRTERIELLRTAIEASGLSASRFAREVLLREDRTVRRWLSGESPIPNIVAAWLESPEPMPWPVTRVTSEDRHE